MNPTGLPGLMDNIIANKDLYPIFFRLAFVSRIAKDENGIRKNMLGIDHYYITTRKPEFISDQPTYNRELMKYQLGWYNKKTGFRNNL